MLLFVQPVELLPKSFSEFKQGLDFTGLSHTRLFEAYTEYEMQRKEKLRAAKKERVKLKRAEQRLQWQDNTDIIEKPPIIDQHRQGTRRPVSITQLPEKVSCHIRGLIEVFYIACILLCITAPT